MSRHRISLERLPQFSPAILALLMLFSCDLFFPPPDFTGPFTSPTSAPTPGPVPTPTLAPTPQPDGNLIYNGNFDDVLLHWATYINTSAGASANISVLSGVLAADIINGSTARWHVQLIQGNLCLNQSKQYALTFDGWAESARDIQIELSEAGRDNNGDGNAYSIYDLDFPSLTTSPQHFAIIFLMNDITDTGARLVFDLGMNSYDVYLDNIKLIES